MLKSSSSRRMQIQYYFDKNKGNVKQDFQKTFADKLKLSKSMTHFH